MQTSKNVDNLIPISKFPDVEKRMLMFKQPYDILPGIPVTDPVWKEIRLKCYVKLLNHFGYPPDQDVLASGGCTNYGNLLYDMYEADNPALPGIDDNSTAFRKSQGFGDFPSTFLDVAYNYYIKVFSEFMNAKELPTVSIQNGTSSGFPFFFKSSLGKKQMVQRVLRNQKQIKQALFQKDVYKLFLLSGAGMISTPIKRTRNDKAAIVSNVNGEWVKIPAYTDFATVLTKLRSGEYRIQGKTRPASINGEVVDKEYLTTNQIYLPTPSRTAQTQSSPFNTILQKISTFTKSRCANYKMHNLPSYWSAITMRKPNPNKSRVDLDMKNFDRMVALSFKIAKIRAARAILPKHVALLMEYVNLSMMPREINGKYYFPRHPFKWIDIEDNAPYDIGINSGQHDTSTDGNSFTDVATMWALSLSYDEMMARNNSYNDDAFTLNGGDDVEHYDDKDRNNLLIKRLNLLMDVKHETPGGFLGFKFIKEKHGDVAVYDLASFVKLVFNPENKSRNSRRYIGYAWPGIKLMYSSNPDFKIVYDIMDSLFDEYFGITIDTFMRLNSDAVPIDMDLSPDEILFMMNVDIIHYKDVKIRDSIKALFMIDTVDIDNQLNDFLLND